MSRDLNEFIKDWEIDLKNKSATHHSGLRIAYDATNEDGSLRLAYSGMMSWNKTAYAALKDVEKVELLRTELTNQFIEIYKQRMNVNFSFHTIATKDRE